MKELLESLEVSEEIKTELVESFDKAVLVEAVKLAEVKDAEYQEYIESELSEMRSDLEEKLDKYLGAVVEEYLAENEIAMDKAIEKEKVEAIQEGIESLSVIAGVGVDVGDITESVKSEFADEVKELQEAKEESESKIEELQEQLVVLKESNAELLKTGLLMEISEEMTALEKEKFYKLAEFVQFDINESEDYLEKLKAIAESVTSVGSTQLQEKQEEKDSIVNEKYEVRAKHLI